MKMNNEIIFEYLDKLIPNPQCELLFNKDYELLIAVMLSAQTTDKRVNKVTKVLFDKYPSLTELKNADIKDIEKIIRELGNYHKKSQAVIDLAKILDEQYDGMVPKSRACLEQMPMVGRKTTNVVLSVLFNIPNIAVDTHVERVSKRLGLAKENDSVLEVEQKLKRKIKRDRWSRSHHQLVLFGRYYCKALLPECSQCGLKKICKFYKKKEK